MLVTPLLPTSGVSGLLGRILSCAGILLVLLPISSTTLFLVSALLDSAYIGRSPDSRLDLLTCRCRPTFLHRVLLLGIFVHHNAATSMMGISCLIISF
jgi:hypothetical protein